MTPNEFATAWTANGDTLVVFSAGVLSAAIPEEARRFLATCGLPEEAAPCLSFDASASWPYSDWGIDPGRHFVIGSEGAGDPLAVTCDGAVVALDHERGLTPRYVNKDVGTLAETLLRYRDLISETQRMGGEDAFLDGLIPLDLRQAFLGFLQTADPAALQSGALWSTETAAWQMDA